jgi:hypothetical protein
MPPASLLLLLLLAARARAQSVVTTTAGNPAYTETLATSLDGIGTNARFDTPMGIAWSSASTTTVYVSELGAVKDDASPGTGRHCIRKVTAAPTVGTVTTLLGTSAGYADGAAISAKFSSPIGLAVQPRTGAAVGLYVADSGNNLLRYVLFSGPSAHTVAGAVSGGFQEGVGCARARVRKGCQQPFTLSHHPPSPLSQH